MADGSKRGGAEKEKNTIHEDAIWRQLIKFELETAAAWNDKWGFMRDHMEAKSTNKNSKQFKLPPIDLKNANRYALGLPTKKDKLIDDKTLQKDYASENQNSGGFSKEELQTCYLLSYNINELQNSLGSPTEKFRFPPTTSTRVGWWALKTKEQRQQQDKNKTLDRPHVDTLSDFKLGRWARGQGDVFKWWGGTVDSLP